MEIEKLEKGKELLKKLEEETNVIKNIKEAINITDNEYFLLGRDRYGICRLDSDDVQKLLEKHQSKLEELEKEFAEL